MSSRILVVGATGKQGSAVLRSLRALPNPPRIRALTRNIDSPSALALRKKGVEVVKGSLEDIASLKTALRDVDAAFLVSVIPGKGEIAEDQQGYNFIEAAQATKLPFIVFTSVSDATPTCGVPHFETKAKIELALKDSGIPHAVVAPVAFFDNFTRKHSWANFGGMGFFEAALKSKAIQMVAVDDIGDVAARMLTDPRTYNGQRIKLAGDALTMSQVRDAFARNEQKKVRMATVPAFMLKVLPHDAQEMFKWFVTDGFTADPVAVRKEFPSVRTFEQWLREGDRVI
ncbi:hypothetical protein JCM8115_003090 [Rhodotorula mucilaginosa]|uniref:NmrA-like domain-containing protein n=1 Tax=Rhodotorula mucilaginosa TaxID=5537 RepID=A0A9P6VX09_RHOMI|nr:hypothetical protein C6P46_000372 [Rhodotorula mucilaginosa]TKA50301.1 hypothetical protein B0A53_06290 [Rhodotorula sp. CCFEE 5036]